MDHQVIVAEWRKRPESIDEAARRIVQTCEGLSAIDRRFLGDWHITRKRFERFDTSSPALEKYLKRTRPRNDIGELIPVGHRFSLISGSDTSYSVTMTLSFGSTTRLPIVRPNSCRLEIPDNAETSSILSRDGLISIVRALVVAWEPDVCLVFPLAWWKSKNYRVSASWLTYCAASVGGVEDVFAGCRRVEVDALGTIFVAMEDRFEPTIESHQALVLSLDEKAKRTVLNADP